MDLETLLAERLGAAFAAVAGVPVDPAVRRSQHADFQSGAALTVARQLGRPPREVATEVAARAGLAGIATAEVSGPGFLNLTVDDAFLVAQVAAVRIEAQPVAEPRTVVIDYSSPNVAKELHVGHLRSTVLGDAAARLLEWQGQHVVRVNHLGDWGTQFGMMIEHLEEQGDAGERSPADLTALYQAARVRFDSDPEFKQRARLRVVALQSGDERTVELWRVLVALSERYFLGIYDLLGVTLTAADFVGESFYNDRLSGVVDDLQAAGLVRVSAGALCAFPAGFTGRDGEPSPLIVRKSDGGFGYAASDLAAVRHRVAELKGDRLLYFVGSEQRTHFRMVWAVARAAGWLPPEVSAEHVAFGMIMGKGGKKLASRDGGVFKLADLLDEAVQRGTAMALEKSPGLSAQEAARIGRAVGIGAVKYADLSGDRLSDYQFDFDRMLALTGNTGPYLQYAYARIRSIFAKAGTAEPGPIVFTAPQERALALELLGFAPVVAEVGESLEFHRLAGYLHSLTATFSSFYEKCSVINAPDGVRASRLTLCDLTARTVRQGLDLLGIEVLDRM
jgi:arginyl-tRNA synthetase